VVALETASRDATYAWREVGRQQSFEHVQVYPGRTYDQLSPRTIFRGVTEALSRINPSAVAINAYSTPDAQAALVWCRRHRRTAVLMMDSTADDVPRQRWREHIKSVIVGQFDAALAAGTPQCSYLEQLGFPVEAARTPYDVVDNAFFADGAARARARPEAFQHLPGLEDRSPFFLASGRFVARKNFAMLLRAYAEYRRRVPAPWRLLLLGDGPIRGGLEALASPGVSFAGFRQIDELPAYYGLAHAFVHPALSEQWGLVVNEAMASGLPVLVSSRVGAAVDLVEEGSNGFTFDPASAQDLARLMERVSAPTTDREAMGRRSVEIIAAWSPEAFAEGLWQAVEVGQTRADRAMPPAVRLLLWGLRTASRDVKSFHAIRE